MADEGALRVQLHALFEDLVRRSRERDEARFVPEQLYHYTSVEGLKGILDSGQIWATQSGYLNDSKEFSYGRELAFDVIQERKIAHRVPITNVWLNRVATAIKNGIPGGELYVACFCEQGDLLSQWRGYGRGCGYSIRLRPKEIVFSRLPWRLCALVQVIYSPEVQRRLVMEVLDHYIESLIGFAAHFTEKAISSFSNSVMSDYIDELRDSSKLSSTDFLEEILRYHVSHVSVELDNLFGYFKHPGFEEEKEWRLIHYNSAVQGSPHIEYRILNGILVPYVELPLFWDEEGKPGIFQITQITCGPSSQPDAARTSVEHYVTKLRTEREGIFGGVEVTNSKTPLKTW